MNTLSPWFTTFFLRLIKPEFFIFQELDQKFNGVCSFSQVLKLEGESVRDMNSRKTIRFYHGQQCYYAKLHFGIGWKEIFKDLSQGRWPVLGARDEFLAISRLHTLGISTLDCVGFGEHGISPAHRQSFLITREISHAISLEDLVKTWKHTPPSFKMKRYFISQIAHIARTLHTHGLNHRDFYLCHFLWVKPYTEPLSIEKSTLYLIDLHRVQLRTHTPLRWRIKDLAGLYYSAFDVPLTRYNLLRFIKTYHQKPLKEIFSRLSRFLEKNRKKS